VTDFGDATPDDSADTAPPDGEALARLYLAERRRVTGDPDQPATLEALHPWERAALLFVFAAIAARLIRERP
jgi:hypothetical protein